MSAKVWWPFALVLIVLLVLTFPGESRAIDHAQRGASDRAIALITGPLVADAGDISGPISEDRAQRLRDALAPQLANDPRIQAIRLWSSDGTLLFSTNPNERVGSNAAMNNAILATASEASGRRIDETSRHDLLGDPSPAHYDTYLALPSDARVVVQVQTSDALLLDGLRSLWTRMRIALAVSSLLVLGLAILSMRRPLATVGAGVPFYEATLPRGHALMSLDEETELRHAGAHAKERVRSMEARLHELEADKLRLEGELQLALSTKAAGMRVIPSPNAAPAPAAEPRVVRVEPGPERPAEAPLAPAAPTRTTVRSAPLPEPRRAAAARPADEVMVVPEATEAAPAAEVTEVPVATPPPRDVVVVPDRTEEDDAASPPVPAAPPVPSEEPVDVLHRLVEPVGARQE
ncbi:MAG: hypothetical protein ACM3OO_05490, partial [Planctomycetaceae bacterium]